MKKLLEKAKKILKTSKASLSEIAYELGFKHLNSFGNCSRSK
ncbi:hypothetical protein [Mucilaginibacter galii]|nr:hypothetical protein [Mucilaginibacter galii]